MPSRQVMGKMRLVLPLVLSPALALALLACDNGPGDAFQGYVEGDYLYLSSPVGGIVADVPVSKGARAAEGDLLFELDPEPELSSYEEARSHRQAAEALYADKTKGQRSSELETVEASIRQAESALAYSKREYERLEELHDKGVVAEERLDSARSMYDRDRAALKGLKASLATAGLGARHDQVEAADKEVEGAQAVLNRAAWALKRKKGFAPAAGLVTDVLYREGEFVPAGYPVVVFLPPERVRVRFFVPEPKLSAVKTGATIDVFIDGSDTAQRGSISYIAPEAEYTPPFIYSKDNREKLVFLVEAAFPPAVAETLHPGQPVEVRLAP